MYLNIIPKDKEDVNFIKNLERSDFNDIRKLIPDLLEWVKDGNWPQADLISQYLSPFINEFPDEIIFILKGKDEMWKYWVLKLLILDSEYKPMDRILFQIREIFLNPTKDDKEAEVDVIADEVLKKFKISPR